MGSGVGVAAASVSGLRPVAEGEEPVIDGEQAAAEKAIQSMSNETSSFLIMF